MKKIEKKLIDIIKKVTKNRYKFKLNTTLTNDILDSFNILEIIDEIEKKFKIKLNQKDLHYKNYTNINKISKMLSKKKMLTDSKFILALKRVGIKKSDNVYVTTSLFTLGRTEFKNKKKYYNFFYKNLKNLIGKNGTIIVDAFSRYVV